MERVGGHPLLDFVNTIHDWTEEELRDELTTFEAALAAGVEFGIVTRGEAREISGRHPAELQKLRALRELVHEMFLAPEPRQADLDALTEAWGDAVRQARLRRTKEGVALTFDAEHSGAALVRHRLLQQTVELLTSDLRERIGVCPECKWVFLDTSKNRSRRWCSMQMCGGLAKARAYYRRQRASS
jgi:predicted RNA-binding Zn ribbon-like protein